MKYVKKKLGNGIYIACNYMPGMESVTLGVWLKTGSRYEDDRISGISHYLEHLLFRGSKNFTATQIRQSIEGVGGTINAFTGQEYTCYFVKIRKKFLDPALKILADMILYPKLSIQDIERERKIIIEEIKMQLDIPMGYVHEVLDSLLWKGHPLGRMICGDIRTVSRISKQDIEKYKDFFYTVNNLVIVACGAVKSGELINLINKYFPDTPSGEECQFTRVNIKQTAPQVKFQEKDTQQTHFAIGCRALCRDHPKNTTLSILNIIMGANMSSRLFDEVREKRGLAYEIGSQIIRFTDTGAFVIYSGIEHRNLLEVIKIIFDQLNRIKERIPTIDEVRRAKEYYKGQLLLALEKTMENMIWLGEYTVTNSKITSPKELIESVNKVTPDMVSKLVDEILTFDNLNLSIIGPDLSKKYDSLNRILEKI